MGFLLTTLIFIAVLFVLILVHEWGHFIVAKKTGMRVDEFGIGFPPKLFGIKKGETEYSINAMPIGGFVRIFGEDGVSSPSSPVPSRDGKLDAEPGLGGTKVVSATVSDYSRSFVARPKWAQALVLIAGVTMNIIFAWCLFVLVFMIGLPSVVSEEEASASAQLIVAEVLPESPAAEVLTSQMIITGLARGDESLSKLTPSAFSEFVAAGDDASVVVSYRVDGEEKSVELSPTAGLLPEEPERPVIGVSLALVDTVSVGPIDAIKDATVTTLGTLQAIVVGVTNLISQMFAGTADYSQVAGPVGIAGLVGDAAAFGFTSLLMFTALISLNLAVINLLPFPALDGGRLLFVAIETITRRRIDPIWVLRLNGFGIILLIALMLAVTYNDIVKLL